MSLTNKDRFTYSFPNRMLFISSSCQIAVARTSSPMLNKRGESGYPNLKGNMSSFCPLSMMLAVSYMAFIMFRYVPSIHTLLKDCIINWCWILSNAFSISIDEVVWFLSFILFLW